MQFCFSHRWASRVFTLEFGRCKQVQEQDTAYGLVDGVQIELERMGFTLVEAEQIDLPDFTVLLTNQGKLRRIGITVSRKEEGGLYLLNRWLKKQN